MSTAFKRYWNLALASVHRQLVAASLACADTRLANYAPPLNLSNVRDSLRPVRPSISVADIQPNESGHKIQSTDEHFQATLQWLQEEVRELLRTLPSDGSAVERTDILRVLSLSADDTAQHFGSLTEGWDRIVSLKLRLLLPDDVVLSRSAWLVALMADFERSLRDAICLPIQCLGNISAIKQAAAKTIDDAGIQLHGSSLLTHERTGEAAAQAISKFMAEGVGHTLQVTRIFGTHLGIHDGDTSSFKRGFHLALGELGSTSDAIISRLVILRRAALHDTSSLRVQTAAELRAALKASLGPVATWDFEKLKIAAQFLYSYSLQFTLGVMSMVSGTVVEGGGKRGHELALVARYKAASELRVGTLVLLKEGLWWLAWWLADYVRERYEDRDGLMLRLNAAFAQSKIGMPQDWRQEAVQIEVDGKSPRYWLLKKSILGEWDGISPVIRKVIDSGDMTLDELASWPALQALRRRREYNKVIASYGKPKAAC